MLKKHNKLILLLVLATFMFSIVGSASAAQFSDVSGNPVQTAAIYKLNALGIIEGYPDGTFGPDKTITRAEFSKIAVNMAGLQSVATGMSNTASVFKDINTSDWFNGFVNVAAAQGYVKGDPSGNFRPNDQITQGEVITVLMRLLGYNDNLPGDWPADYISKAANLEILDDITFVANKAATRADVALMGSETLDQYCVEYQADSNTFINDQKVDKDDLDNDNDKNELITFTLVEDKFKGGLTEDAMVYKYDVPQDENGNYKIYYYTDGKWEKESKTFADNFVVANGKSVLDVSGKFVDFIVNDDDEIVYVAINDYGTVKDDEMKCKGSLQTMDYDGTDYQVYSKVELNSKDYDFADNVVWIPDGKGVPYMQMKNNKEDGADWYIATLNDDGDIACMTVSAQASPGIVDYVNADRETISFKNNPQGWLSGLGHSYSNKLSDLSNKTYFVTRNGVPAKLADIKEGDSIIVFSGQNDYAEGGFAGVDYFIIAIDPALLNVKGTLTSVEANADGTVKKVTVADKEYKVISPTNFAAARDLFANQGIKVMGTTPLPAAYGALAGQYLSTEYAAKIAANPALAPSKCKPYVSTDGGDDFNIITDADYITGGEYDLLDEEVTLVMTPNGKVGTIISNVDDADSGRIFGSIISIVKGTTKGSDLVNMVKIVNKDDKEASYAIDDDTTYNGQELANINAVADKLSLGQMVSLTLTGDGYIDNIKTTDIKNITIDDATDIDDDLDSMKINGSWYAAKSVTVFNYKSADEDAEVVDWNDVQDTIINGGSLDMQYYIDNNQLKYIGLKDAPLDTDVNYALYVKNGKDSDDPYAVVIMDGKEQKVYLNNDASYTELKKYKKGNLLMFKWEGSDIKVSPKASMLGQVSATMGGLYYAEVTDLDIDDNIVEVGGNAFLVDEDTVYYDATDHDNLKELTAKDVARGDNVYAVYDKDDKILAAVVITDDDDAKDVGITAAGSSSSTDVPVTGVTLSDSTLSLTAGGAAKTLTATVAPANATNKTVSWSSDNTAVATVANGVVTPVAAGTAVITVTTADGHKTASCTVTVTNGEAEATCTATYVKKAEVNGVIFGTVSIKLTGVADADTYTVTYPVASTTKTTPQIDIDGSTASIVIGTLTIKVYDADGELIKTFTGVVPTKVN